MSDYDLVIVGGGPAGISTALHVLDAMPAAKLVVLEAKRYPRDKICAGGIGARAFKLLANIGVEVDCPRVPLDAIALRLSTGETVVTREPGLGAVVRRIEFDHAFANIAIARGIDVRDGCPVAAIAIDEHGVHVTTEAGDVLHARALVGADGVGGITRAALGFPRGELRAQVCELDTPATSHDLPRDTVVFDFSAADLDGYAWDFPTIVRGEPLVCRGAYVIHRGTHDTPKRWIDAYLARRGLALGDYKLKQFAEQGWQPEAAISSPRAILVGEAAGIDIATGEGIGQAIEYGALAGPYLARGLASNALDFGTWRAHVRRHHLGWQLRLRHACYRLFYSHRRGTIERMMPSVPGLFRAAVQDFAGVPMSTLAIARGTAQLLAAYINDNVRDASP